LGPISQSKREAEARGATTDHQNIKAGRHRPFQPFDSKKGIIVFIDGFQRSGLPKAHSGDLILRPKGPDHHKNERQWLFLNQRAKVFAFEDRY
jgi:hypothetical protein